MPGYFVDYTVEIPALSRYAPVLDKIHTILSNPTVVAACQAVMKLPNDFHINSLKEDQRTMIELVTCSFDRAGFYLWSKLIPEEYLLPEYPGAIWHWRKLEHYIKRQRKTEGYEAKFFFEYMAKQTERFRKSRNLPI